VNTANLFTEKGQSVTLLILDITKKSFYPINPAVQIVQQPLSFGITPEGNIITRKIKLLSDVLALRKTLKKLHPDIIITTEYPFTIAAVLTGSKKYAHLIAWEHHHFFWLKRNRFWETLYNLAYPRLHDIICLNKEEASYYDKFAPVSIIPNFVESISEREKSSGSKTILSVGWLIPRKGIDMQMKSAKEVLLHHPDWKWKLVGEGEMENEVLEFIAKEKLDGRFILQRPSDTNIANEYTAAELFVLSSRYEAFPMVLLEALSFGLPCISFDCSSGPSDIIIHQEDGLLVEKENPVKLAEAVSSLIEDETTRRRMSEKAVINIKRYSKDKVYSLWEGLLRKI
jgi:glycosyltransferase involved in cell wall biosynthesis